MPKIGPWRDDLDRLLEENACRSKRERLTLVRVFEELRNLGYDGGYDAVRRYAASWSRRESEAVAAAFVPLSFDPGEAYQFDWSHENVVLGGVTTTLKVAHVRLCHSRMLFVRAYPRESQGQTYTFGGVRRPRPSLCLLQGRLRPRDLRQPAMSRH
jgi:transposase